MVRQNGIALCLVIGAVLAGGHSVAQEVPAEVQAEALRMVEQMIARNPKDPEPYRLRAGMMEQARKFDEEIRDHTTVLRLAPDDADTYYNRSRAYFKVGKINESLADSDQYLKLRPQERAGHWERGISLYYAGRFEEGVKQFELHQTVNTNDVENAVWHYMCMAKLHGIKRARAALIPITGDRRVPMMEVHAMFAGRLTPAQVLERAEAGDEKPPQRKFQRFYAHLYIGLFHEAAGERDKAREHMTLAATDYAGNDYMSDVARVHLARMKDGKQEVK